MSLDLFLDDEELKTRIAQLKKERNAVILAHSYERPEVQDIADYVGDSLELSRLAAKTDASRRSIRPPGRIHAGTSGEGQSRRFDALLATSDLPESTCTTEATRLVRSVHTGPPSRPAE